MDLHLIFGVGRDLTWTQECARAILIFLYGFAAVRLFGRRIFGKWAALDIVVSIVIGSNLSRTLTGSADLWKTLAASSVLLALHWGLAQLACRMPVLARVIEGRPADLVREGEKQVRALHRWGVSGADINEALRSKGIQDPAQLDRVILEPSGTISVLKRPTDDNGVEARRGFAAGR